MYFDQLNNNNKNNSNNTHIKNQYQLIGEIKLISEQTNKYTKVL